MKKYTKNIYSDTVSEMFMDTASGAGGASQVMCWCGKMHYALQSELIDKETLPPESDNVVHHDEFFVYYFEFINHQVIVPECTSCQTKLKPYEDFVWQCRGHLTRYISLRTECEEMWRREQETINKLKDSVL